MLPELAGYSPAQLAASSPSGLALVEKEISEVITTLNDEIDQLNDVDFPTNGHIAKRSFGGGDPSPELATHHARAHNVVVTTLTDLRKDLTDFLEGIQEAKTLLAKSDDEAESEVLLVLQRTQDIDLGQQALPDAQVQHRNDVATDTPVTTTEEEQG